jgi:hypothetical protein
MNSKFVFRFSASFFAEIITDNFKNFSVDLLVCGIDWKRRNKTSSCIVYKKIIHNNKISKELNTYQALGLVQSFCSSGNFPQKLQLSPSLLRKGLWLAQVPANFPSFLPQIFMAIPANAIPSKTTVIKNNSIIQK